MKILKNVYSNYFYSDFIESTHKDKSKHLEIFMKLQLIHLVYRRLL